MEIEINGWNSKELEFVADNFYNMTNKDIALYLNKKTEAVSYAANKLGLKKQNHSKWTDSDIQYLKDNYMKTSEELGMILNKSVNGVNAKRALYKLYKDAPWTESDEEYLKKHYETDSHADIAKVLNRTEGAVRAKCHDLRFVQKDEWTEEELNFLKKNYYEYTNPELAKILNRTEDAVQIKAGRMGLKKSPYHCNYGFFDYIDTEEKAYWLGFMTADGWISRNEKSNAAAVGVEIQYGDIKHLKKLNKSIEGNYKITDRWKTCSISKNKEKKNHMCCLRIYSMVMYNSLVNLGFTNNKSYDIDIPDISKNLLPSYLRGYFDGDGVFCYTEKTFGIKFLSASYKFMCSLQQILLKEINIETQINSYISEYNTTIYTIMLHKKKDKMKLLDYIYQGASIYLDRKYEKYQKVKNELKDYDSLAC